MFAPPSVIAPPATASLPAPLMTLLIVPLVLSVNVKPETIAMLLVSPIVRAALCNVLLAATVYPAADVKLMVPLPALIVRPPITTVPAELIV